MANKQTKTIDVLEMTNGIRKMFTEHTKLLLDQYKTIKGIYGWPNKVFLENLRPYWPESTRKFFEAFDMWLEQDLRIFEENIDKFIDGFTKEISELKIIAPTPGIYQQMIEQHTKLWIENYKKIRERREQVSQESFESLKKMLPITVQSVLETTNRWMMEQAKRVEDEFLKNISKLPLNIDFNKD